MNVGQLRNYYEILGIPRNATNDEIKKSFRRLARLYHPDINPDDKTAEEKFKDINEAYDILLDETKRADFDQKFFSKDKRRFPNASNKNKGSKSSDFWKSQDFVPGKTKRAKVVNPPSLHTSRCGSEADHSPLKKPIEVVVSAFASKTGDRLKSICQQE